MKKFWKALGIATLATALPVRFKKDEITGKKTFQSLLISVDVGPGSSSENTAININLGDGLLSDVVSSLMGSKRENIHFADDEPEAAVVYDMPEAAEAQTESAGTEESSGTEESAESEESSGNEGSPETAEPTEEDFDPEG